MSIWVGIVIALAVVSPSRWPGFLGPADKQLTAEELPTQWSSDKNVAWTTMLSGYGQSSPVVWDNQVIVTTVEGAQKEKAHIACLDLSTGQEKWKTTIPTASQAENTDYVSRAAPTPLIDEHGAVVFFESGNLLAVDLAGKIVWQRDLVAELGPITSRHGISSSPVRTGERVFVWVPRDKEPYVLAVDRSTGKTIWKKDVSTTTAWSSPVLLPLPDGTQHLVLSSSGTLQALSTTDGSDVWKLEGLSGNTTPTPQVAGPGQLLLGASAGRDGGATKEVAQSNGLLEIKNVNNEWKVDFVWRCEKATCSFNSPLLHEGLAYFVNRQGVLICVDAKDGKEVYTQRIGHSVWATPLGIGSRIYFVGEEGVTTVIQSGRKYQEVARNQLWEPSPPTEGAGPQAMLNKSRQYAVVAIPGKILLRRGDRVYCIQ